MKIHEYQGKEILRHFGIPVPNGFPAYTAQEALEAAQKLGGNSWIIKAQIHAGGRGKAGGVRVAHSSEEVYKIANEILDMTLVTKQTAAKGQKVRRLYVEQVADIRQEYYLSITTDRSAQKIAVIASSAGGMDIEEVARNNPEKIIKIFINPLDGINQAQAQKLANKIEIPNSALTQFIDICQKLYACYMENDASLIEINPLNVDSAGNIMALDAKFNFDDNALYRHPEIMPYRDLDEEDPNEVEASKFDLAYISLDGNIGCLVNGAGLAMATMDTIKLYGAKPANFLDVGGSATVEKVTEAFKIMLRNDKIKAILVNIFGGIMKCDTIAEGIVAASHSVQLNVPLVVRMKGTNEQKGKKILAESGLPIITANTMDEAAEKVVAASKGTSTSQLNTVDNPVNINNERWGKWIFLAAIATMAVLMLRFCGNESQQNTNIQSSSPKVTTSITPNEIALGAWQAQVKNGKLILQGAAQSEDAKKQILASASAIFGDNGVENQLVIDESLSVFQGAGALSNIFAWQKQHDTAIFKVAKNKMTFTGTLREAFITDLSEKIHTWFDGGVLLDVSNIQAQRVQAAQALKLGLKNFRVNVKFNTGQATLLPSAKDELDALAKALKENPVQAEIEGHTDNVGSENSNLKLSQKRAETVKTYLIKRGVDAKLLTTIGYGQAYPIADNNTEKGRQRNRRINFVVR